MKTGKLIEALMHYRHVSLEDMANETNIAQSNIATLLTGKRNITPSLAEKMCKVLDIDPIVVMTNRMVEELKK
jgi:plasmid maintenance system antidote protein VapI